MFSQPLPFLLQLFSASSACVFSALCIPLPLQPISIPQLLRPVFVPWLLQQVSNFAFQLLVSFCIPGSGTLSSFLQVRSLLAATCHDNPITISTDQRKIIPDEPPKCCKIVFFSSLHIYSLIVRKRSMCCMSLLTSCRPFVHHTKIGESHQVLFPTAQQVNLLACSSHCPFHAVTVPVMQEVKNYPQSQPTANRQVSLLVHYDKVVIFFFEFCVLCIYGNFFACCKKIFSAHCSCAVCLGRSYTICKSFIGWVTWGVDCMAQMEVYPCFL